jgi:hypothetical protein
MMNATTSLEIQFPLRPKQCFPKANSEHPTPATSGRLPRITQVLAAAINFENMISEGVAEDYADIGRLSGLSRERISQVMRLNYLAPDIQIELLYMQPTRTGRFPISETAVRRIANLLSWAEQRQQWTRLKHMHHLN